MADRPWKTKLEGPDGIVVFDASVSIPESRSASYDPYSLVHMPVDLYAYRNTTSRTFSIRSKLVSRNGKEADKNLRYLDMIRRWILPKFGDDGAPPPILKLTAYDNRNIRKQSCIMKSYSWEFPEEVDYIFEGESPMPIIGNLSIELVEIYSANEILANDWELSLNGSTDESDEPIDEISKSNVFNFSGGGSQSAIASSGGGGGTQIGISVSTNGVLVNASITTPSISSPTSGVTIGAQASTSTPNGFNRVAIVAAPSRGLIDV